MVVKASPGGGEAGKRIVVQPPKSRSISTHHIDSQFALELAISRTPARKVLCLQEREGFLVSRARRGGTHSLYLRDIHEIFDINGTLARLMAGKAVGCRDRKNECSSSGEHGAVIEKFCPGMKTGQASAHEPTFTVFARDWSICW